MDVARDDEVERELSLCGSIGQFAFKITTPQFYAGVVREGLRLEVSRVSVRRMHPSLAPAVLMWP